MEVQEADYINEVANAHNSGRNFKTVIPEVLRTDDTDTGSSWWQQ